MWQADLHGVAKVVTVCLEVYADAGRIEGQTSGQVQVAGRYLMFLSLSWHQVGRLWACFMVNVIYVSTLKQPKFIQVLLE